MPAAKKARRAARRLRDLVGEKPHLIGAVVPISHPRHRWESDPTSRECATGCTFYDGREPASRSTDGALAEPRGTLLVSIEIAEFAGVTQKSHPLPKERL